ncbi:FecCD family ABC transporter permease [Nocardioides plantarum]|uniref:FecCD family ABC transporter permease n=1 Tax=Nocardioides plantarum TaxID=29299 RepID=A0ABV5KBP6_9ACTN|nr:iron ABC transporter permease [Nocardioides plantarum]
MSTPTALPTTREATPPRQGSVRGLLVLGAVILAACLLSLMVGSNGIAPWRVLELLAHGDDSPESTIVRELRTSRTALCLAVGLCLGISGALMQGHTRNPLADPGLLGVTSGAAFAVVVGIYAFGVDDPVNYAWFSLVGAGAAAALVFAIGTTRGGPDPVTLVLAGTAVSALLAAGTQTVILRDLDVLDEYRVWVVGSVNGADLGVLLQVSPFMLAGLVLAAACSPGLNLLQLGDDVARSLGMRPGRHKLGGIAAVMLLAGAATAAVGPISFVGLVVPHVARWAAGTDYRWVVPYAGLVGALLMVLADVLGRVVVRPGELQVGIVMALVGGPVFVILVRRTRMVRL